MMEKYHNLLKEDHKKLYAWSQKPMLRMIYHSFYSIIKENIDNSVNGKIVELGSGIANIKEIIDKCTCTDIYPNPWIDNIENAYELTYQDGSVSNLILFDVFHHLEFPGNALDEFHRVLNKNGRLLIFEPSMSLVGLFIYGIHQESLGLFNKINWYDENAIEKGKRYYAAQANSTRIFNNPRRYENLLHNWKIEKRIRISSFSYFASGGYSKAQVIRTSWLPVLTKVDNLLNNFPLIFAARELIVLVKKQ